MAWTMLVHMKEGDPSALTVTFETGQEAEEALQTLSNQIEGKVGLTTISGRGKLLVDTRDVRTAEIYQSS